MRPHRAPWSRRTDRAGISKLALPGPAARGLDTARPAWTLLAVATIAAVTVLAFAPVRHNGFVWDDVSNLVNNEHVEGFSTASLHWMFTHAHGGHYHPLTWLSFAADWHLWGGLSPVGVHYTNLLLHVLTAIGFYFVARRLLEYVPYRCSRAAGFNPRGFLLSELSAARADSVWRWRFSADGNRLDTGKSARAEPRGSGRYIEKRPKRRSLPRGPALRGASFAGRVGRLGD